MEGVFGYKFLFALVAVMVALIMSEEALAAQHVVGGSQGWEESADFSSWASAQKFKIRDQLGPRRLNSSLDLNFEVRPPL